MTGDRYLVVSASTAYYECTVTVHDGDSCSYESDTVVDLKATGAELHHTDRNTLRKVG